ncbi:MAG: M50 family metallopeptidase, partial [Anaerolineaceae bacterium]|nr:M50 family metallopeptidase [Anaerolineaceae bacterium]
MKNIFKQVLFNTGCLAFSFCSFPFLHEGGHALATILTGGQVSGFNINPLGWSYLIYPSSPPNLLFTAWGGILFSTFISLFFIGIAFRYRNPFVVLIGFLGIYGLLHNGLDFIFGMVFATGDPSLLLRLGVPSWSILLAACFSLLFGSLLAFFFQPMIGIKPTDLFAKRFILLGLGFGLLRFFVTIYNILLGTQ